MPPSRSKSSTTRPAKPKASAAKPQPVTRSSELNRAAERLKQVSDATRLRVLLALAQQPRNVTQLREELGGISQPALSHHLALLRHGRIIEPSRQGKSNVYDLTPAGRELAEVVGKLMP
jgi:DNA-binding transcriptional ArsR family regulator